MTATLEAPAPAPAQPKLKPGKVWYWVFGLLTLFSLIAAGAIWLTGHITVENDVKAFARFVAPNEAQLRFKRDGQYVIYYEYAGTIDETKVDAASTPPDGIQLEMRDAQGQALDLRQPPKPLSYDVGGYSGVALRQVRIDQPGEYTLSAGPSTLSPFAIAVGRGDPPTADSWSQTAILVGAIGAGLGILGLIVTALLRRRHRAALADRQTAAALAAPLATAAPLAPAAAGGWAAPGEAGSAPGTPPPPGPVVPPPPPTPDDVVAPPAVVPPAPTPVAGGVTTPPPPPPPPGATPGAGLDTIAPLPGPAPEPRPRRPHRAWRTSPRHPRSPSLLVPRPGGPRPRQARRPSPAQRSRPPRRRPLRRDHGRGLACGGGRSPSPDRRPVDPSR